MKKAYMVSYYEERDKVFWNVVMLEDPMKWVIKHNSFSKSDNRVTLINFWALTKSQYEVWKEGEIPK